jgi:hypothetical protein
MQDLGQNGRGVKSKSATPHQQTDDASRGNRMMDNLFKRSTFSQLLYLFAKIGNRETKPQGKCLHLKNSIKSS